ncbi:protein Dr1-like [Lethenteron reissneri]|uniref:protein Dr1-like n=1 Tax=Lethenteron reissneri TaxID=7753 RepID=UPI002AB6C540|nr:protein Dr1-like [Lethenteron reissneri]XP_061416930.1 protein Dr1-like [Lethenteron reissneri]
MASPLGVGGQAHDPDEVTLPYASVQRLVGELVPCLRLTAGARDLLRVACTRFVRHVSSEANTACAHAQRKTISPEHVIQALERLGLAGSMGELRACHAEFRALALSRRRATRRLEALGVPEPELLRQQQALIEQARQEQTEVAQRDWLQIQCAAEQAQRTSTADSPGESSGTEFVIDEDDDDDITDD